ncbi:AraC family transcriptional regulator ligand-binding domain-containing protein [Spongiibacter sp. KMU-158]|uniref:AraC family transcriptional regulator ligand-binding domain-containing protein n=1 Tax=Spongiibacter pelagi TaxID=2760804 RepID=A0A927C2L0_9GAMM|nr:AraC family transcriptional regulator [Spongiibacter pelagi]MBD2860144.1 AraC family transcriptional regulator ligand-binding domain-containing protein [Spongiibacter pelagi]
MSGANELIRELGGAPEVLAEWAGLPSACLSDRDIPVDVASVLRLLNTAAANLDCRNIGMILAARNGLDVFGPLWILLRSARTVHQMLEDLTSNYDMYTRGAALSLQPDADGAALCWDTVSHLDEDATQAAEYGFALCVYELRRVLPSFTPRAVQFRHVPPQDIRLHRALFGNELSFNQDRNAIYFSHETLGTQMSSANSRAYSIMQSTLRCDASIARAGLNERIENIVRFLLPYSPCTIDEISDATGLSIRTLQNRLTQQGTSFKQIKDQVRYDLALKYLRSSDLSLAEISEILGYSELSAFSRSFRRWHGQPASAVRRVAIR